MNEAWRWSSSGHRGAATDADGMSAVDRVEDRMLTLLKRHQVQTLLAAGHDQIEVARIAGLSERSVRRIAGEPAVAHVDDRQERNERRIGRPSKVEAFRRLVQELVEEVDEERHSPLKSVEILRRARLEGYEGGKSALYELIAELRPHATRVMMRFEGLPGEFSQHDFGEVRVSYLDGTREVVRFFGSRLKWSRWAAVDLVPNQVAEPLVRTLADHFVGFGGVPLCAVFDRPKTVVLRWAKNGEVTEWNPIFAYAAMELGFTAEVCWPRRANQKGSIENLVGWVKGSFFKQRRFHDRADLQAQLQQWLQEVNCQRPNRATSEIPEQRRQQELPRLRPLRVAPERLALRIPIQVGVTAEVSYDGRGYAMPPEAAGMAGTLYLYRDTVHIVAGRYQAQHPRYVEKGTVSRQPEHRAAHLAAVSGKRGRRYLQREHLLETGEAALQFMTVLVHRAPRTWFREVEVLHQLLQQHGAKTLDRAFQAAVGAQTYTTEYVVRCLNGERMSVEVGSSGGGREQ